MFEAFEVKIRLLIPELCAGTCEVHAVPPEGAGASGADVTHVRNAGASRRAQRDVAGRLGRLWGQRRPQRPPSA